LIVANRTPIKRNQLAAVAACIVCVGVGTVALAPALLAQDAPRTAQNDDQKRWQAVAPGRVEPWSGEIKVTAPVVGRVGDILIKPNDVVAAGELLIRLQDDELTARLATADATVAMRKRARNDQSASARAADRRRSEDAVADGERSIVDLRAALDTALGAKRTGKGSDADIETSRTALTRAEDKLKQDRAELRRLQNDSNVPLPTANEGALNIARAEWSTAAAVMEKMMVRAPLAATVLQVNARAGELASPSLPQPLLVLGDISSLRVRAEVDERDFGDIRIGQAAIVRAAAFRGREIAGKVSSIAPIVDAGRINRGQRNQTDVNVVEVVVDLAEPGPLTVGMKVDVYFKHDGSAKQ
jgi:HlyD family secretion protein